MTDLEGRPIFAADRLPASWVLLLDFRFWGFFLTELRLEEFRVLLMQALNVGNLCPSSVANDLIFPPEVDGIFELLALLFEAVDSATFRISELLKLPIACSA